MKAQILIVDDEEMLRLVTRCVLEAEGYEVLEAADAKSLRGHFSSPAPALVILDLELPDGHGLTLLPELKQHWPGTKVLILTGHGTVEVAESAFLVDDVYLQSKPFDGEMLKAMVAMALPSKPSAPPPPAQAKRR